jgi:hypothetical protein
VLADRLRVLNEAHPHLYARRGAVSVLHPFGGEKVRRTFSSFRLTPLKRRESLASTFPCNSTLVMLPPYRSNPFESSA